MALGASDLGVFTFEFVMGVFEVLKLQLFLPSPQAVTSGAVFFAPFACKKVNIVLLVAAHTSDFETKVACIVRTWDIG